MEPPKKYWYTLIESEKRKKFDAREKSKHPNECGRSSYHAHLEPDPELDEKARERFKFYTEHYETMAKAENWIDFLTFLNLDEKQRTEHLALLSQQRLEYNNTVELLKKTRSTFTDTELEKVLVKAREYGIMDKDLYDQACWKKMVAIHKDLSTIGKIWAAVANMPENAEKYRTLLIMYTHVHTCYHNHSLSGLDERAYQFYLEHGFKGFLHQSLIKGEFNESIYEFHSGSLNSGWSARPQCEYMRIVKAEFLEKLAKISSERKVAKESDTTETNLAGSPILYSQASQQLQATAGAQTQMLPVRNKNAADR